MPQEQTEVFGRDTNHPFTLFPSDNESTVRTIGVWAGWGSGDADGKWVVKGIKLTWNNGDERKTYNHAQDSDQYSSFTFAPGETADWTIRAGWRIDRIEIESSAKRRCDFGGESAPIFSHVAKGALIGFEGSSGWEIDCLSIRYNTNE
ncbi:hypothetical protein BOTNAR_2729g00010 [Botryotinia narcissicola]|uniref:Jacalin-type lectin domain-containing protein n=1 Tax=Botryotinia narcissicola TaxID=278944 RepID=A0A4Z1H2Z0_9HELO|nr:hypothetical protein BOTNAR_2729g00010 [Botryotinia narcissicola]